MDDSLVSMCWVNGPNISQFVRWMYMNVYVYQIITQGHVPGIDIYEWIRSESVARDRSRSIISTIYMH